MALFRPSQCLGVYPVSPSGTGPTQLLRSRHSRLLTQGQRPGSTGELTWCQQIALTPI
jgi:hypothetical protein